MSTSPGDLVVFTGKTPSDVYSRRSKPGPFTEKIWKDPHDAASLLNGYHARKDAKRYALAEELQELCYYSIGSDMQMLAFIESGLLQVLVNIAADTSTYGRFRNNEQAQLYVFHIMRSLEGVVNYLDHLHRKNHSHKPPPCVFDLLDAAPKLWRTLWKKRALFFNPEPPIPESDVMGAPLSESFTAIGDFIQHMELHLRPETNETLPFPSLAHFLFYQWMSDSCSGADALHLVSNELAPLEIPYFREFFHRTLDETEFVERFSRAIRFELETNYSGADARVVLTMNQFAIYYCPALVAFERTLLSQDSMTILHYVAYACQRQFCQPNDEDVDTIIMPGLMTLHKLLDDEPAFAKIAKECVDDLQIIPMVSKVIVKVAKSGSPEYAVILGRLCYFYLDHWKDDNAKDPKYGARLRRIVCQVWRPVMEELQALPLDDKGLVDVTKHHWEHCGRLVGLSGTSIDPEELANHPPYNEIPYKWCQWRECMCSNHKPQHRMKVCKGCWQARYCGEICQRRDWLEGGHRDICGEDTTEDDN